MTDSHTDTRTLTQRLKEENADLHELAEHDALPSLMARGELPREAYVDFLGQMWLVNRALDRAVAERQRAGSRLLGVIEPRSLQTPYLEADLATFGVETDALEPTPGAAGLIEAIEAAGDDDERLLGLHYVREGANNGNRYVAKKLRGPLGLDAETGEGTRYLDPYGADQRPLWEAFKARLDALELSDAQRDAIVAAARSMFEHIRRIHADFADRLGRQTTAAG